MIQDSIDVTETAVKNLGRAKTRTLLTLLGVIIGIAAIVSLFSIGSGLNKAVSTQLEELGSNIIFVTAGGSSQFSHLRLTDADLSYLESTSGVDKVIPIYTANSTLEFNGEKVNTQVTAVESSKASFFDNSGTFQVEEGRLFSSNESAGVILGNQVAHTFFDKNITANKQVLIGGQIYRVIGILKPQQQSFGGGFNGSSIVFMSLDGLKRIVDNPQAAIVFVTAVSKEATPEVTSSLQDHFDEKYGEGAVRIASSDQILAQVNQFLNLITIFLTGVGGISIIVGGVGIMNAMVTSVLERTKEIGVMKALGASNNKVLALFLLEAGLIGAVGGILGVIFGYMIALLVSFIGQSAGFALSANMSMEITFGAIIFSILIGMGSGFFPALRASRMDPVSSLRYE